MDAQSLGNQVRGLSRFKIKVRPYRAVLYVFNFLNFQDLPRKAELAYLDGVRFGSPPVAERTQKEFHDQRAALWTTGGQCLPDYVESQKLGCV